MRTATMPSSNRMFYCECCGKELNPARIVWMELSNFSGNYYKNEGECPESESQGWFTFGPTCARKILKKQVA